MSTGVESLCIMMLIIPFFSSSKYFASKVEEDKRGDERVLVTGVYNRILHIRNNKEMYN